MPRAVSESDSQRLGEKNFLRCPLVENARWPRQRETKAGPYAAGSLRALSLLIRRSARPLSERQRDAHRGFAYFVGEHAILDRARQYHTANA